MSVPYPNGKILDQPNLREFSFAEMKLVTKNFKPDTLLGQGGFGKVYKGWVDEQTLAPAKSNAGMVVAIKKLNSESVQGFQEWQVKLSSFITLDHPSIHLSVFKSLPRRTPRSKAHSMRLVLKKSGSINEAHLRCTP